jgi:putative aldouronate transport system substrate-binding protein
MNKFSKKALYLFVSAVLIIAMLAGCTSSKDKSETETSPTATTAAGQTTEPEATQAPTSTPIPQVTLSTIGIAPPGLDPLINGDSANTEYNKELVKRTGVTLKYTMTTNEDYDTKLNLMISSGDVPDFFGVPSTYPGGAAKALQDGLILDLSKYLDTDLPNLKKLLDSNPEWKKGAMTDSGAILGFPNIKESKAANVFTGAMIRKDLLDKVNLPVPETIDEWHTMLTAFKKIGVKNPFTSLSWFPYYSGDFAGAYVSNGPGYSVIIGPDGKPMYGPIASGYKDYLTTMHQWYKEGLIDPDFITLQDWDVLNTKITSGQSAATVMFLSRIVSYTAEGKKKDPNFQMVAAPHPVLKKGDIPYLGQIDPIVTPLIAVSAKSKNIHDVLRYWDYRYSEEGTLLSNFGIEGESYTLDASGKPHYSDLILATPTNAKGWTQQQALGMYVAVDGNTPTLQLDAYFDQTKLTNEFQKDAVKKWSNEQVSSLYPNVTPNDAETETIKKITDIDTYAIEMTAKFILGSEPIANFDKYVEHVKSMGIEQVIAAQQSALDRYNKR